MSESWDTPKEDLGHPDAAIRLASAVHRFQVPKVNVERKLSFVRSFKTTGHHPKTKKTVTKADEHRKKLTEALRAKKVSHERVVLDAKRYQPFIHQILMSCKVQPEMARLDERLVFEWMSGIEKKGNNWYKSEAMMYDLVMCLASEGLGKAGVATEASLMGEFAQASREYAAAAGIFAFLADDHIPKWKSRSGQNDDCDDLPLECHVGTAQGLRLLFQAAGQQMAVATLLIKPDTPNYGLVAKLCLGISQQLDEFVEHMRKESFIQMNRMDTDFFTLVAFQTNLQKALSSYFHARSLFEQTREYGLAIAVLSEATIALQTRPSPASPGLPDVLKVPALKPLHKDLTDLRAHMAKLLKAWEKDNSSVFFESVPQSVPVEKKLKDGLRIGKCEKYKLTQVEPVLLDVPENVKSHKRSDSDIARELQQRLDAGLEI